SGYASLETQRHFDYWTAATARLDGLLDLWGVSLLAVPAAGQGDGRTPLASALDSARGRQPDRFVSLGDVEGVELVRNARSFPRACGVGRPLPRGARDERTALERMQRPDFAPHRDVVLEEGPPPPAEPLRSAQFAPADLRRPSPERIEVQATLDAPGYLVVT